MASSDTGSDPVVVESDEDNHSQDTLDLENNFKCQLLYISFFLFIRKLANYWEYGCIDICICTVT